MIIKHICSESAWEMAKTTGEFIAATLATEGFMHCSMPDQLQATAGRYYPDPAGMVVLTIDTVRVTAEIKLEIAKTGEVYPHIYGSLNINSVDSVDSLSSTK